MKNYFTLFILLFCVSALNAQVLPNGGLESWEDMGTYEDPEFWSTPNPFTSLTGVSVTEKSEDAAEGMYSARLETKDILGGLFQSPGLLTLAEFEVNFQTQEFAFTGGLPLQDQVSHLTGKYKYAGVDGDSASILIYSTRHPEGEEADTVALGFGFLQDAAEWTDFTVYMMPLSEETSDTFNIIILSSGSFDVISGSVLYIDDLSVSLITDIPEAKEEIAISTYPNPVVDRVTFEAKSSSNDRNLVIYDVTGRQVSMRDFSTEKIVVDLSAFPAGIYTYRISSENDLLKSGQLVKR
jgi:hypothetical protein